MKNINDDFILNTNELAVVVYSASSDAIDKVYVEAAARLGELLAKDNITCINGGGNLGLMGAVIDSVLSHGGKVKGVIPKFMVDSGWCHQKLSEQIVTNTMHERTLEELLEIITWKQLGLYKHPIIILNTNNYYSSLLKMFDNMIEQNFMHERYRDMWRVVNTPEEAVAELSNETTTFSHLVKFEKS